jgi:hypothetical protein
MKAIAKSFAFYLRIALLRSYNGLLDDLRTIHGLKKEIKEKKDFLYVESEAQSRANS